MSNDTLISRFMQGGIPNKQMVASFIEGLTAEEKAMLKWPGLNTVKEILFIWWIYSYHSGRGVLTYFCCPSRKYLALKIARMVNGVLKPYSERYISEITNLLEKLGLIIKEQPKPQRLGGPYLTNRYYMGSRLREIVAATIRKFFFGQNLFKNRGENFFRHIKEEKIKDKRRSPFRAKFLGSKQEKEPIYGTAYQEWRVPKEWEGAEKWYGPSLSELFRQAQRGELV